MDPTPKSAPLEPGKHRGSMGGGSVGLNPSGLETPGTSSNVTDFVLLHSWPGNWLCRRNGLEFLKGRRVQTPQKGFSSS